MINLLEKSKHPIYILEGPDGVGKTSLGMALQQLTGAKYMHLTYRFKDKMDLYHSAAIRLVARAAAHQPVILDRWWISEIVYADAYRGGSKFYKTHFLLDHIADKLGAVYVMCLPKDRDLYLKHYNVLKGKREEMYDEGMERVYDGFDYMYKRFLAYKDNCCHYDMFQSFAKDDNSRNIVLSNISQNILEFTEDYRETI